MLTRRLFLRYSGGTLLALCGLNQATGAVRTLLAGIPGGTLDPANIAKFATPLLIPPVMPKAGTIPIRGGKNADYYEISIRQFRQQILPPNMPSTTVWGYGPVSARGGQAVVLHNAPSLTLEAQHEVPIRVKWINELTDAQGRFLPHLLPVDPTLHWANPPGGMGARDTRPTFAETPGPYTGPVPMVTHVHGAVDVSDTSDGYAEAWYLPRATDIPAGYATEGTWFEFFRRKSEMLGHVAPNRTTWEPGSAVFQYPNRQRAATLWYHDHTLGMTRLNVYAGPAGFYIVRGGPSGDAAVRDVRTGRPATLPGPAPAAGDKFPANKPYYEVPIAIQDRSFNADGSLFYPDARAFFDEITGPFIPEDMGFSPIWNPEFFGNTIMVNGATWPFLAVEARRYRFRLLNGCQSRVLVLDFAEMAGVEVWQIGNEGGFLAAPVNLTAVNGNRLLLGLAERADVIVDFTNVAPGRYVLRNLGPDEPFGGGEPGVDFDAADPATTGQVMEFRVGANRSVDRSTPPRFLVLPVIAPLPPEVRVRKLALIEKMGMGFDANGEMVDGPMEALLGNVVDGEPVAAMWMDAITENPQPGDTEVWEFYNTTADAHPMHVHDVTFEVVNRQALALDEVTGEPLRPLTPVGPTAGPEAWETGRKDTVLAYPGQVTRIRATFNEAGQFVWHCHIVEHEDNEMMRPFRIGPPQMGQPGGHTHP